jgi:hypothetical protein
MDGGSKDQGLARIATSLLKPNRNPEKQNTGKTTPEFTLDPSIEEKKHVIPSPKNPMSTPINQISQTDRPVPEVARITNTLQKLTIAEEIQEIQKRIEAMKSLPKPELFTKQEIETYTQLKQYNSWLQNKVIYDTLMGQSGKEGLIDCRNNRMAMEKAEREIGVIIDNDDEKSSFIHTVSEQFGYIKVLTDGKIQLTFRNPASALSSAEYADKITVDFPQNPDDPEQADRKTKMRKISENPIIQTLFTMSQATRQQLFTESPHGIIFIPLIHPSNDTDYPVFDYQNTMVIKPSKENQAPSANEMTAEIGLNIEPFHNFDDTPFKPSVGKNQQEATPLISMAIPKLQDSDDVGPKSKTSGHKETHRPFKPFLFNQVQAIDSIRNYFQTELIGGRLVYVILPHSI